MTVVANTTPGLTHLSIGLATAMRVRNIGAYITKCQRAILSQLSGRGQRLQNVPKPGPRNETGGCRFLSKHMARNAARRDSADTLAREWERYACRIPARGDRRFDRRVVCATLTEVYHVAHVPDACRIIEDGRIKAGLIGDESRLRRTRTSVCWLSANYWHPGSIYGTVQFTFRWDDIIRDRHVYWVEDRPYTPRAYRFLITDRDPSTLGLVQPYDPEAAKGPLRLRDGTSYWNAQCTSEFMVDADLPLRRCVEITTITHRDDRCRLYPSGCAEATRNIWSTGAQTLAYVIGRNLTHVRHCFVRRADSRAHELVRTTLGYLLDELTEEEPLGPIKSAGRRQAVMTGALLLYGAGQFEDAQEVVQTLASRAVAQTALETLVRARLRLPRNFSLAGVRRLRRT
jgi:hypothetical protein